MDTSVANIDTVSLLERPEFFIREHVGFMKLHDVYDILDPKTQVKIGEAREEISGFMKFCRMLVNKAMLPTTIEVVMMDEAERETPVFSIRRGFTLFRPRIDVFDTEGNCLGYLRSKMFSLGGAFRVFTPDDQEIALVKGDWKGWNFRFLAGDTVLGIVSKEWAGIGKELFTSADNYMISLHGEPDAHLSLLLLAAGLSIDMVLKEKK